MANPYCGTIAKPTIAGINIRFATSVACFGPIHPTNIAFGKESNDFTKKKPTQMKAISAIVNPF